MRGRSRRGPYLRCVPEAYGAHCIKGEVRGELDHETERGGRGVDVEEGVAGGRVGAHRADGWTAASGAPAAHGLGLLGGKVPAAAA